MSFQYLPPKTHSSIWQKKFVNNANKDKWENEEPKKYSLRNENVLTRRKHDWQKKLQWEILLLSLLFPSQPNVWLDSE